VLGQNSIVPYHAETVQRGVAPVAVEDVRVSLLAVVLAAAATVTLPHLPVTTNSPQAQAAVDRGLFFYYAFNGDDAAHAFAEAATLDSRLAMAYWGVALADGPDLNTPMTEDRFDRAASAMRKVAALPPAATPLEQGLINAMTARYKGSFADWSTDDATYRQDMSNLGESSDDENVELLAAEALLEHGGLQWRNGTLADAGSQQALEIVNTVLRNDPSSAMGNHLCIHLYDLAPDRAPALPCAERLDATTFPPEAEHLAHMPAHYWIEVGDYAAAMRSSDRAFGLLSALEGNGSEHASRYAKHDVAVGYSAAMMLGDYAAAQSWSERMSVAFGTTFDAVTALRFGRYAAAYSAPATAYAATSVRGMAAVQLGHLSEAIALAKQIPANQTQAYLQQLFLARLAEAQGNYSDAERWIDRARANQQANLGGELIPLIPADEALGDLRLRRGDNAGAATAFQAALSAYPNDPRALFGLSQALGGEGQSAQAAAARARFEKEWKGADTNAADALL
jgi:hypothetical protein